VRFRQSVRLGVVSRENHPKRSCYPTTSQKAGKRYWQERQRDAFKQQFGDVKKAFETWRGVLGVAGGCERIINPEIEVNKGINSCKSLTDTHTHALGLI